MKTGYRVAHISEKVWENLSRLSFNEFKLLTNKTSRYDNATGKTENDVYHMLLNCVVSSNSHSRHTTGMRHCGLLCTNCKQNIHNTL